MTRTERLTERAISFAITEADEDLAVARLEALGATRYDHQQERGFDFWVMRDPVGQRVLRAPTELPRAARPTPAMDYLAVAPNPA
jgi:hypothetical protein